MQWCSSCRATRPGGSRQNCAACAFESWWWTIVPPGSWEAQRWHVDVVCWCLCVGMLAISMMFIDVQHPTDLGGSIAISCLAVSSFNEARVEAMRSNVQRLHQWSFVSSVEINKQSILQSIQLLLFLHSSESGEKYLLVALGQMCNSQQDYHSSSESICVARFRFQESLFTKYIVLHSPLCATCANSFWYQHFQKYSFDHLSHDEHTKASLKNN